MAPSDTRGRGGSVRTTTRRGLLATVGAAGLALGSVGVPGAATGRTATGEAVGGARDARGARGAVGGDPGPDGAASIGGARVRAGHEISAPTTIAAPGTYEVVADVATAGSGPCIEVQADDVTLLGNGHALSGDGNGVGVGVNHGSTAAGDFTPLENVVVEDLAVTSFAVGVQYDNATGGRIEGVTATANDVCVEFVAGVVDVTVRNSTLAASGTGFATHGNPDVYGGPDDNRLEHNCIEDNDVGIDLGFSTNGHAFVENRIVRNGGGARHRRADTDGHTYSRNVICRNAEYGIWNEDRPATEEFPADEDVVVATENYWGAVTGPSSMGDPASSFTDPTTFEAAGGDGDAISESLDPGVANVRFDPFLATAPPTAGLE